MPQACVTLTPFEEQVMETVRIYFEHTNPLKDSWFFDEELSIYGKRVFGLEWGGSGVLVASGGGTYPVINRFLGRLQNKGLVKRTSPTGSSKRWGKWYLTDLGREMIGLPTLDT